MNKPKILLFLAAWRRPEITRICFHGIRRLQKEFDIKPFVVLSEPDIVQLCSEFGFPYSTRPNNPLGAKKNAGLKDAAEFYKYDFDYVMEIGSDDLVLNDLVRRYNKFFGTRDFFGIVDCAMVETESGLCRRLISGASVYGGGRCISKAALEKVKYHLWKPHLNRGLDSSSVRALQVAGIKYQQVRYIDHPQVIGLKSDVNIWKFNHFLGKPYDPAEIFAMLSPEENELINQLRCVEA